MNVGKNRSIDQYHFNNCCSICSYTCSAVVPTTDYLAQSAILRSCLLVQVVLILGRRSDVQWIRNGGCGGWGRAKIREWDFLFGLIYGGVIWSNVLCWRWWITQVFFFGTNISIGAAGSRSSNSSRRRHSPMWMSNRIWLPSTGSVLFPVG